MLADGMKSMSAEAKAAWEEVSLLFPDQMSKASFFSSPKPSKRRPDSHWDYIVHGEELQNLHTTDKNGNRERVIDGHLDTYKLRAKKVDPSKLGVDSVKQYSGYLDDEENDKHLFYCESNPNE
jgi:cathepsin A (carboxypeptidase C)